MKFSFWGELSLYFVLPARKTVHRSSSKLSTRVLNGLPRTLKIWALLALSDVTPSGHFLCICAHKVTHDDFNALRHNSLWCSNQPVQMNLRVHVKVKKCNKELASDQSPTHVNESSLCKAVLLKIWTKQLWVIIHQRFGKNLIKNLILICAVLVFSLFDDWDMWLSENSSFLCGWLLTTNLLNMLSLLQFLYQLFLTL